MKAVTRLEDGRHFPRSGTTGSSRGDRDDRSTRKLLGGSHSASRKPTTSDAVAIRSADLLRGLRNAVAAPSASSESTFPPEDTSPE